MAMVEIEGAKYHSWTNMGLRYTNLPTPSEKQVKQFFQQYAWGMIVHEEDSEGVSFEYKFPDGKRLFLALDVSATVEEDDDEPYASVRTSWVYRMIEPIDLYPEPVPVLLVDL